MLKWTIVVMSMSALLTLSAGNAAAASQYVGAGPIWVSAQVIRAAYTNGAEVTVFVNDQTHGSRVGLTICQDYNGDGTCTAGEVRFTACGFFRAWQGDGLIDANYDVLAFVDGGLLAGSPSLGCGSITHGTVGTYDVYC